MDDGGQQSALEGEDSHLVAEEAGEWSHLGDCRGKSHLLILSWAIWGGRQRGLAFLTDLLSLKDMTSASCINAMTRSIPK